MKTRQSFVTNSSSSSFIISCNSIPTTYEESLDIFFGTKKEYVAPIVSQYLYENLKEHSINFNKVLEIAKNNNWNHLYNYWDTDEEGNEPHFLGELVSIFHHKEKHINQPNDYTWCSWVKSPIEEYVEANTKEPKYIDGKYNNKSYKEEQRLEAEWMDKPEMREKFLKFIEYEISDLKKYPCQMQVEVGDNSELGGEIEHDGPWKYFPSFKRFSHH